MQPEILTFQTAFFKQFLETELFLLTGQRSAGCT
jgi:hypothetical protein